MPTADVYDEKMKTNEKFETEIEKSCKTGKSNFKIKNTIKNGKAAINLKTLQFYVRISILKSF